MSTNLVLISGVLSKHELRYTPKGTPLLEVSLIGKRSAGENHLFFRADFTFYGKLAENWADQLVDGQAYQATGRLVYESWEVDGVKGSRLRIVGEELFKLEQADIHEEEKGPVLYGAENRVILSGGLTADPEIRQTSLKTPVAKASLGFSSWDASAGQAKNHYVELEAWRDLAVQFAGLKKGSPVLLEGALKTEVWEDKETKTKRYKRILEVQRVTPLSRVRSALRDPEEPPLVERGAKPKAKTKAA
ncbi:single-stranded DNA-binding protein [uncultured Meiothermus sp.]|jgi:single-strand DNA-binding protein|uniref:single-stranded DNA-binding protein n=1 Tax=uncultured Meiothermus sp. TaxID=157471 RepID=UPI00261D286A|nr:single-stranded DNA-binding protein [uncultured Meiothermus sp.]